MKTHANAITVKNLPNERQKPSAICWWLLLWERRRNMEEYKDGWPRIPGWYDCLVEGEEMKLKFYVCQVSMKPHWLDKDGNYIETQYKVKWK